MNINSKLFYIQYKVTMDIRAKKSGVFIEGLVATSSEVCYSEIF